MWEQKIVVDSQAAAGRRQGREEKRPRFSQPGLDWRGSAVLVGSRSLNRSLNPRDASGCSGEVLDWPLLCIVCRLREAVSWCAQKWFCCGLIQACLTSVDVSLKRPAWTCCYKPTGCDCRCTLGPQYFVPSPHPLQIVIFLLPFFVLCGLEGRLFTSRCCFLHGSTSFQNRWLNDTFLHVHRYNLFASCLLYPVGSGSFLRVPFSKH